MLKNDFCYDLKFSRTHCKFLALEMFSFFDFSIVSCYLFKFNIDKKCPGLIREHHWFKTGTFKMFGLDSKSSYQT